MKQRPIESAVHSSHSQDRNYFNPVPRFILSGVPNK
jgi:hypothetical protein